MLSRRSVRVKVMQLFFAMNRDESLTFADAKKLYQSSVQTSYDLFLYNLFSIVEITKVASEDEVKRQSKHLPSEEDKKFTAKLYTNELIQSLADNAILNKRYDALHFRSKSDQDFFKKIYTEFAKEESYAAYILKDATHDDHLEILLELFRYCRRSDYYNETMEEKYLNWIDDKSLVVGAIKKSLKAQPTDDEEFFKAFFPDSETVEEYGKALLIEGFESDESNLEIIKPVLDNWDHERVAVLDMVLIKMAITEFLHFPTIPTKVTINEYVDIAKQYSTAKSKDFINGVLDKAMKVLEADKRIKKEGRGLQD